MATSSNPQADKPTTTRRSTGTRRSSTRSTSGRTRSASSTSRTRSSTTSTQARTAVERAVLVPLGAGLLARDNLVSTAKGVATKYRTRGSLEREFKRYERRGASARNRFERQVRRTRTKFERELRQRRTRIERGVRREVRSVRRDLGKQSDALSARVKELIGSAS